MNSPGRLFCFVVLMFAAVAVSPNGAGSNDRVVKQSPGKSTGSPAVAADSLPVPWGKKPGGIDARSPKVVADSLPVPWGKKPGGTLA